jgi:sulfate adenylyltransferase
VNGSVLPEDVLRDAPSYTPHPHELADLELLLSGAYAPLTGFLGRADLNALRRRGRLADGTPWPVAVTLEIPDEIATRLVLEDPLHRTVILTDPEGAPVAALEVNDAWPAWCGPWATAATARSSACAARRKRSGPCCHRAGCSG